MKNVIIIGNGPAGISAALYTMRANIKTTVIGRDLGALQKADKIENYYGFAEPISGKELVNAGIAAAKRLGCEMITDEVVSIGFEEKLTVITKNKQYPADAIILATGTSRSAPKIQGIKEYEGKGISYCAVCDAFFYRGKDVCVLGNGDYALHEAQELVAVANSVTILTNGEELATTIPCNIQVNKKKIKAFEGEQTIQNVLFEDGETLATSGIFIAVGVASSSDLAKKLGAQTEGVTITVNENMATNIPGLYAAGDCVGGLLQISKAVSDGAKAGTQVIKYIRGNS
ncbi:FAD-dependent oxidoreductase [Paludicola sp. MB14-C6]|uniref:NAD(P)/FAD-dependent oxidoreductase n=1 Tax=Paludihabitans sp. MB14-C6 TaxID=3070656 RepID=UPI0027DD7EF4|nr:FAD-dependent oxidoreductase [Paludicola sp. MB14-C6]WMJ23983.1 FAD-dependent oxidoreductase [Paludicola sp. MB14-C6]